MTRSGLLMVCTLLVIGCSKAPEQAVSTTRPAEPAATTAPITQTQAAPAPSQAPPAAGGALASQETNWKGITATITEFRRKGNTLTAKVRLTNSGSAPSEADIHYEENYLIDTAGGKKYEVLKDEKSTYIAGLRSGWKNRWYETIPPGESRIIWMKFPAPPSDVKMISLQILGIPPFEDVAIQD